MNSRHHDILCLGVAQVKYVIDHLFFIGFYNAVFVADIHDGTKLRLGHCVIPGVRIYPEQHENSS